MYTFNVIIRTFESLKTVVLIDRMGSQNFKISLKQCFVLEISFKINWKQCQLID